jgi:hypothetical protein
MTPTAADEKIPIMPDSWSGLVRNVALRDIAPAKGYVADENTWQNLWEKWHDDQSEPPKIDFNKEIVLVATSIGPNRMFAKPRLNEEGALLFAPAATLLAGPGFGYLLARIPIEGIKSINQKPFSH